MLQLGKNTLLMVQPVDNVEGDQGLLVAELTENSYAIENDILDERTKMRRIVEYGENSESFELSAYAVKNDPGQQAILKAIKQKKKLKVWEFDRVPNETGAYNAVFAYCIVESADVSHGDSFSELSATLQVDGSSVEGELTELPEMATQAPYEFEKPGETS